ncbi:PucR family transcriptional regulator [Actinokineospora terrae]|uniref:PucR C-terminal helix-turn-helix domain-containing protein n=1 Tax=Actinokineospora terrae TaxID=155974 RepID=A0A1H9XNL0_9PSEU|nr:helix-turn-helix domain-containing protein [Actinokineospora terrae]SES47599.1 PucR C-terminal helix-turn-helix domain-containing protein [Actinokineospora terrae]
MALEPPGRTAVPLWASVVPELAERVRPLAPTLIRDAVLAIQEAVPEYRRPLAGRFREVLVGSVRAAVLQCLACIADPGACRDEWYAVLRHAGRVEYHEGRTMDALQTAVRVGARAVWRHVSAVGQELGVEADTLLTVAEAIFAYVDDLCVIAVAGYTEARAGGSREQNRKRLLRALLAGPSTAVEDLAAAARWPLPERLCVVLLDRPVDARLPEGILADLDGAEPCLVAPAPVEPGDWAVRVVVGPSVPAGDAHRSLGSARHALALARRGVLPDDPVLWCDQHLSTLLLFTDETLVRQAAGPVLAALDTLTDKQRGRIATTLRTWLHTRGDITETASRLSVHPQTVRYRMHHVDALLGPRLADPEQRFLMELTAHIWSAP